MSLADVRSVHLVYRAEGEITGCEDELRAALKKAGIELADSADGADAIYKVKMASTAAGLRKKIDWGVALETHAGERFFADQGTESGWSKSHACGDLAPDLADQLKEQIRVARAVRF